MTIVNGKPDEMMDNPLNWKECPVCLGLGEVETKTGRYEKCLECKGIGMVKKEGQKS